MAHESAIFGRYGVVKWILAVAAAGCQNTLGGAGSADITLSEHPPVPAAALAVSSANPLPAPSAALVAPSANPSPVALASAHPALAANVIWEGKSAGMRISWTSHDVTAASDSPGSAATFSLARQLRQEYEAEQAELGIEEKPCRWEDKVSVLSVVGSLLSLERKMYSECARAAHPGGETRYLTVDLQAPASKALAAVDVATLFPPSEVFDALSNDSVVKKALQGEGPSSRRKGKADALPALVARLSEVVLDEPCVSFPGDLLTRYTFHHVEKSAVIVRMGLPGPGPCRDAVTKLGLKFAIPASLGAALSAAEAQREGFLMKDASNIAKGRSAVFEFGATREAIEQARNSRP